MDVSHVASHFKGSLCQQLLLFITWAYFFQDVVALQNYTEVDLTSPPTSIQFDPTEISSSQLPDDPFQPDPFSPRYPQFPTTYEPVLTGKCPVNFPALSSIMEKTASDCSRPLAPSVANVICCPQFSSLVHIFQGYYSINSSKLVLQDVVADDCFADIVSILASRGANVTIPSLCFIQSSNLTGGSCPVSDVDNFEKMVNTSKLLDACSIVDPLKECCRPVCQPEIVGAALQISRRSAVSAGESITEGRDHITILNDCKRVVYSYLSRKLSFEAANTAFRRLSSCKVNKVCPLEFKQPTAVVKACRNIATPSPLCCSSLNSYIAELQKQMLITNKQAIVCAMMFGSMLRKGGVITNIYELCDVDLKDFSLQEYGQQGCLLRSLPADIVYDNLTGFGFTCDLTDNIAAPWPSSSSISSVSLCAPEMSLPALPTSWTPRNYGCRGNGFEFLLSIISFFIFRTLV